MEKQQFAALFGPIIRAFAKAKPILHLLSFSLGLLFFYFVSQTQIESLGLQNTGFVLLISIGFTIGAAYLLEYLHWYVPSIFFRLLFTLGTWWNTGKTWLFFFALAGLLVGLTWFSQHTSSQGAKMGVDHQENNAPPPVKDSLKAEQAAFFNDSVAISSHYQELLAAEYAAKKSSEQSAAAPFDAKISQYQAALIGHRKDKDRGNQWAQSWIDKRNGQIATARAKKKAAIVAAGSMHQKRIAEIKSEKAQRLIDRSAKWSSLQQLATDRHQSTIKQQEQMYDNRRAAGSGAGWWVVLMIVVLDCLIIGYEVGSGREYIGAEWKPNDKALKWIGTVWGIFTDKADHLQKRTEATRTHLQERNEAKPFSLPSGRVFARGLSLLFVLFAAFQLPEITQGTFAQFSVVGHPWNWALALAAVASVVLAFYDSKKTRIASPVDTNQDAVLNIDKDNTNSLKHAQSRVAQNFEGDTESGEIEITTEEITNLKKLCRTNYERMHTAATQAGRTSARNKHKSAKAALKAIGKRVYTNPEMIRKVVKRDGEQIEIAYRKLVIS